MHNYIDILIPIFMGSLFFILYIIVANLWEKRSIHVKLKRKLQVHDLHTPYLDHLLHGSGSELFVKDKSTTLSRKLKAILDTHKNDNAIIKMLLIIKRTGINIHFLISVLFITWVLILSLVKLISGTNFVYSFVIGGVFSTFLLKTILQYCDSRREKKFMDVFPLALDIISRGLRAGVSVEKTFQTVANEIDEPVKKEFKLIIQQLNFGVSFEQALRNASHRIDVNDFNFFVSVLILQKKTGGTSSDLIAGIAHILRTREELRRKVKALSAEAKVTGLIVGSLPVISLAAISVLRPEYIGAFQNDPLGRKLFLIAVSLLLMAAFSIKKLVNFEEF